MDENEGKVKIERILGLTVTSNAHFDYNSGILAYPAGNAIVLLDVETGTVISHVVLETKKSITSVQLVNSLLFTSSDETNYIRIVNWESSRVKDLLPCPNVICCAVSSLLGILVTVGSDRVVSVWDYKGLLSNDTSSSNGNSNVRGRKLASSSVAGKVSFVAFSPDGKYFVTAGHRHLKFWYLQLGKNECVLTGRPGILGSEHSNAEFRDVITDGQATYAIANFDGASATLCQLCPRRFLDKWVQLKSNQAFCMCMDDDLIFIGCADGIIRCFKAGNLDFCATLPLPHNLGIDVASATDVSFLSSHPPGAKFPNVIAVKTGKQKVIAAYADHSLYIWDVRDVKRVGLSHSWLWHSGCIWDIAVGKPLNTNSESTLSYNFPFVTCSNDDTIRCWDITSQTKSNLYSNECVDIKYISTRHLDSPLFISHGNGVRSIGIGSSFLCCGDRQGNLRIWGAEMKNEVIKVKAHKEEILSIDVQGTLVATASRDGSVNVYNVGSEIERISNMMQHNGSVTCVKFIFSERAGGPSFQLVSCGADKNFILRQIQPKSRKTHEFSSVKTFLSAFQQGKTTIELDITVASTVTSKTPLFDLEIDTNGKHVLLACQDACIRVYNISNGKHSKTLRNSQNISDSQSTFIKMAVDPSGYYVAAAATDKSITVFDYYKGNVVSLLLGHSELATSLKFTPDYKALLSVGGDSCIFVWNLPREMVVTMKARMSEKKARVPPTVPPKPNSNNVSSPSTSPLRVDYRFNLGQLPEWAKKQLQQPSASGGVKSMTFLPKKPSVVLPQGKWSERVEKSTGPLVIKTFYDSDSVVPLPLTTSSSNNAASVEANSSLEYNDYNEIKESQVMSENKTNLAYGKDDEEVQSSDFYSDINKSTTDGELSDNRYNKSLQSGSDTDESSSTRTSRPAPSKRLIDSFREPKYTASPFDIIRSRNTELIMSVKAKNREISKSRLELEKRLEATRKKLQSIGYKSMSQSTQDLSLHRSYGNAYRSPVPMSFLLPIIRAVTLEAQLCNRQAHQYKLGHTMLGVRAGQSRTTMESDQSSFGRNCLQGCQRHGEIQRDFMDDFEGQVTEDNRGIRRACSLSDLNVLPTGSSSHVPPSRKRPSFNKHRKSKGGSSGAFDPQNIITRSTSMSALSVSQLQQSDSEPESLPPQPSYMSKTISSHGKSRRKQPIMVSAYSQENIYGEDGDRLKVSASEQNLANPGYKLQSPMARKKMAESVIKKPQQIHGVSKGLAVVTGVRQGGREEIPLTAELASSSVDALRKSLDQVIHLKDRVMSDTSSDHEPIVRILDEGLRSIQTVLHDPTRNVDLRPKIISEHEPALL